MSPLVPITAGGRSSAAVAGAAGPGRGERKSCNCWRDAGTGPPAFSYNHNYQMDINQYCIGIMVKENKFITPAGSAAVASSGMSSSPPDAPAAGHPGLYPPLSDLQQIWPAMMAVPTLGPAYHCASPAWDAASLSRQSVTPVLERLKFIWFFYPFLPKIEGVHNTTEC